MSVGVTTLAAVVQATDRLRLAGVESPRLEARILLERCLGLTRAQLYARPDRELTADELARYFALVARREAREPLAYVVGQREFFGLELATDPGVLVPRPETEILVEEAIRLIGDTPAVVADVGTGSGAIAIALAASLPRIRVYALDVSAEALAVAAENCRRHGVADQVTLCHGDLLAPLPELVDLIAANLPYLTAEEMAALQPEVAREPTLALAGGSDGLDLYRRLLAQSPAVLRPGGAVLLEIGSCQGPAAVDLARENLPMASVRLLQDYAGLDRVVVVETSRDEINRDTQDGQDRRGRSEGQRD